MNLQETYSALLTENLVAAEGWNTKLLGREPDCRPMETLVQWGLSDQGGSMLSTSDEIAGRGVIFLYVEDVAAKRLLHGRFPQHHRHKELLDAKNHHWCFRLAGRRHAVTGRITGGSK